MRRGSVWQLEGLPATPTQNLPRGRWLALRRAGIGGSDIAGILDISPWSTRLSVYCDKAGLRPDEDPTVAQEYGLRMEPTLRKWAEHDIQRQFDAGYRVLASPYLYQHHTVPIFLGNVDGVVIRDEHVWAGLELKTVDRFAGREWKDGMVPEHYQAQAQWYMGVTGLERWILAALIGKRFELRCILRDEGEIDRLQLAAADFWEDYVEPRIMPEASGSDGHLLLELYADSSEDIIQETYEGTREVCAEYLQIQRNIKILTERKDSRKAVLEQRIGAAKGLRAGEYIAIWSRYKQTRVDGSKLRGDYH